VRERILERFGVSRASIHFAYGQFLEDSTQKMLPQLHKALNQGPCLPSIFSTESHTALLQAAGAVYYQVMPGTWVTASRYPACCATNGSNRSSACRIVPSLGNGSSG
jgi:hypothetical protein